MIGLVLFGLGCGPKGAPPVPEPASSPEQALFAEITVAYARGDAAGALSGVHRMESLFPESRAFTVLGDWQTSLDRMGKAAPPLDSLGWQGPSGTLVDHPATLLVFFEPWCPHCQEDVPRVEQLRREYEPRGLGVIGVTALSHGSTAEALAEFVAAGELGFPIGVEDGSVSEAYGVAGVPHLVFVREGLVVWAGHPSLLTLDLVGAIADGAPLPIPMP